MTPMIAADLSGHHLGRKIRITGELGDVAGVLTQVWHQNKPYGDRQASAAIHLDCGNGMKWNQTVPATTPVAVELARKEADHV